VGGIIIIADGGKYQSTSKFVIVLWSKLTPLSAYFEALVSLEYGAAFCQRN
jgi:hypothetical protein